MEQDIKKVEMLKKANEAGFDTIAEFTEHLKKGPAKDLRSAVNDITKDLMLLTLYQKMEDLTGDTSYMNIVEVYDRGVIAEGNSMQIIHDIITGIGTWDPDKFIPDAQAAKFIELYEIVMYVKNQDGTKVLADGAFQFKKWMTTREEDYIAFFKNGVLNAAISSFGESLQKCFRWYMFDKIARLITTAEPQATIEDTKSKNMFECFSDQIIPIIEDMQFLGSKYNYDANSEVLQAVDISKVKIYANQKIISKLRTVIKSQLFGVKFFDINGLLESDNFRSLGNKLIIGNDTQKIKVSKTEPYIDENTIYIVADNAIDHIRQVEATGVQNFPNNLTIFSVLHYWGAVKIRNQGAFVKYTCANLNKEPGTDPSELAEAFLIDEESSTPDNSKGKKKGKK